MRILSIAFLLLLPGVGPAFSQPATLPTSVGKTVGMAVVVGVSHYMDEEMPDLKFAHRDAEAFAAFLLSPGGGGLSPNDVRLLTNEQATSARFAAALDWLFERPLMEGKLALIYFAGYGGVQPGTSAFPHYFLMTDSPISPLSAGAFDFQGYFNSNTGPNKKQCALITNVYPLVLPSDMQMGKPYWPATKSGGPLVPDAVKNMVTPSTLETSFETISKSRISLNNLLLDGLLGLADRNGDGFVTNRELGHFLKRREPAPETWPSVLTLTSPGRDDVLASVNPALLKSLSEHSDGLFPSIIHLETTKSEDALLAQLEEMDRYRYQDFIIAIKLGHLLEPSNAAASTLYDSLLLVEELKPLHGNLRRKLAAALLDDSQQALNAYLRTDIREIVRRKKDPHYRLYPIYLERANELLGERHYMRNILKTKQLYFEGLLLRFDAEHSGDTALLEAALAIQQDALSFEPDAAFVINEIGVLYQLLGKAEEALAQFRLASGLAPNWSIPYSNLCFVLTLQGHTANAIEQGKKAIRLSPRNLFAFNSIGNALMQDGNELDAEKAFVRAIALDPDYPDSYYNLACLKSRQGHYGLALEWLEQALQKGFDNEKHLRSDDDLAGIRSHAGFAVLLDKYFSRQ